MLHLASDGFRGRTRREILRAGGLSLFGLTLPRLLEAGST